MKTILLSLFASIVLASAQSVTNANIDLVWSQSTEDALRIAYKIDENLRTNGIAPYVVATNAVTYKVFISELLQERVAADSASIAAQNEARFLQAFRALQVTNASAYARVYRITFNKGNQ